MLYSMIVIIIKLRRELLRARFGERLRRVRNRLRLGDEFMRVHIYIYIMKYGYIYIYIERERDGSFVVVCRFVRLMLLFVICVLLFVLFVVSVFMVCS